MNSHLTPQQISEWMGGERSREAEMHVRACAACQAEVDRFEAALSQFRSSVREWSAEEYNPHFPAGTDWDKAQQRNVSAGWRWAVLAILSCVAAVLFLHRSEAPPQPIVAKTTVSDAVLLKQVDQDASRTVPGPMEPLVNLVSWDGSSAPGSKNEQ